MLTENANPIVNEFKFKKTVRAYALLEEGLIGYEIFLEKIRYFEFKSVQLSYKCALKPACDSLFLSGTLLCVIG
jgi:hypothetical protein